MVNETRTIAANPAVILTLAENAKAKIPDELARGEIPEEVSKDKVSEVLVEGEIPKGLPGVEKTDFNVYLANYQAHKPGISHEEMVKVYDQWAASYDDDLRNGRYNGPEICAKAMAAHYPEEVREKLKILDVAAGTGRVGEELHKLGFRNFDALEPSRGMLDVLIGRNIYGVTYECGIGIKPTTGIPANTYDSLVIAGGMGEGHIPVNAVDEMIRVVKPGGTVVIVMREEYLSYVQEYVGRLEPYMDDLEMKRKWKQISRTVVPEYSFHKNGVVFIYEVKE